MDKTIASLDVQEWNSQFENSTPEEIVLKVLEISSKAVATTNFRPYEATILHAVTTINPQMPIIWCDTGYNTPQTYQHAQQMIDLLNLNISLYAPLQTTAYRDATMGIPSVDDPNHALFTEQVKLEPFRRAMEEHQPQVWFTNLRKGQTPFRDNIGIFSTSKEGILKVSPFYYWSDGQLDQYINKYQLLNEFNYYDPTKVLGHRECGLHN